MENRKLMEHIIDKRFKRLEMALDAIRLCTQPVDGHTDPLSIQDCWDEVNDYLNAIKSISKRNVYIAWITAKSNEYRVNYDQLQQHLGTFGLKYIQSDNNNHELDRVLNEIQNTY